MFPPTSRYLFATEAAILLRKLHDIDFRQSEARLAWTTAFTQTAYQVKGVSGGDTIRRHSGGYGCPVFDIHRGGTRRKPYTVQCVRKTRRIYSRWATASIQCVFTARQSHIRDCKKKQ
jgi:hypothetical protein